MGLDSTVGQIVFITKNQSLVDKVVLCGSNTKDRERNQAMRRKKSTTRSVPAAKKSSGRTTPRSLSKPSSVSDRVASIPLKPYQGRGVEWLLAHPFAALFLDPGLGKTLCVLLTFWLLRRKGYIDALLVIAPLKPCYQVWPAEVTKWGFGFSVAVLHDKGRALVDTFHDIYVINNSHQSIEFIRSNIEQLRKRHKNIWLIVDESHHFKNRSSERGRFMDTILQCFSRRTILTGTPAAEGYLDLFGQLYLLDLGVRLGKFITHFRQKFFLQLTPDGEPWNPILMLDDGRKVKRPKPTFFIYAPKPHCDKAIESSIKDICLRFSDRDLGLEPWTTIPIYVDLPAKARAIYDKVEEDFIAVARNAQDEELLIDASNAGVLGIKLRQLANGGLKREGEAPWQLHYEKAEAVLALLEELNGKPLLVAYEFHHDRERLLKVLGEHTPFVDGSVGNQLALDHMAAFNSGRHRALLVQSSMMEGLNLQEICCRVCWHSLTWRLTNYIQLIKRVHRLGQKYRVIVYHIIARNTRDERVADVLARKDRNQKKLCDALRQSNA